MLYFLAAWPVFIAERFVRLWDSKASTTKDTKVHEGNAILVAARLIEVVCVLQTTIIE